MFFVCRFGYEGFYLLCKRRDFRRRRLRSPRCCRKRKPSECMSLLTYMETAFLDQDTGFLENKQTNSAAGSQFINYPEKNYFFHLSTIFDGSLINKIFMSANMYKKTRAQLNV